MKEYFIVVKHKGQWWVKYKEGGMLVHPFGCNYLKAKIRAFQANMRIKNAEAEELAVR